MSRDVHHTPETTSGAGASAADSERAGPESRTPVDIPALPSFLRHIFLIWYREIQAYFSSPIAYVFITAFLLATNYLFVIHENFFTRGEASLEPMFSWFPWLFVILVPAITMGMWASERQSGTFEVLSTLPLRDSEIVLGKFLGGWTFLCVAVLFTLPLPFLVSGLGVEGREFYWSMVLGGYIGTFLLGAALVSLGAFLSSLCRSQILAFVVTFMACSVLTFFGSHQVLNFLYDEMPELVQVVSFLGLGPHFERIAGGNIPLESFVYFFSLCLFFLFLNHAVIRTWKFTS